MEIPPCSVSSSSALASGLLGWFAGAKDDEREMMVKATYGLWLARNETKDGRKMAEAHTVAASVVAYMAEWAAVHERTAPMTSMTEIQ